MARKSYQYLTDREAAVGSYLSINDMTNEMVLQPSTSSNDVKTVVSTNHEMASTSSLVQKPLTKRMKKYRGRNCTNKGVLLPHSRIKITKYGMMPAVSANSWKRHGMAEYRTEKHTGQGYCHQLTSICMCS